MSESLEVENEHVVYSLTKGEGIEWIATLESTRLKVDEERNRQIHKIWRRADGWYDLDGDEWAIVAHHFPGAFFEDERARAFKLNLRHRPRQLELVSRLRFDGTRGEKRDRRRLATTTALSLAENARRLLKALEIEDGKPRGEESIVALMNEVRAQIDWIRMDFDSSRSLYKLLRELDRRNQYIGAAAWSTLAYTCMVFGGQAEEQHRQRLEELCDVLGEAYCGQFGLEWLGVLRGRALKALAQGSNGAAGEGHKEPGG